MDHGDEKKTIADFRLSTRTFYVNNPIVQFWYWQMNYHTEHHMYANVPCYHLVRCNNTCILRIFSARSELFYMLLSG